jgi:hypothetical protein
MPKTKKQTILDNEMKLTVTSTESHSDSSSTPDAKFLR